MICDGWSKRSTRHLADLHFGFPWKISISGPVFVQPHSTLCRKCFFKRKSDRASSVFMR